VICPLIRFTCHKQDQVRANRRRAPVARGDHQKLETATPYGNTFRKRQLGLAPCPRCPDPSALLQQRRFPPNPDTRPCFEAELKPGKFSSGWSSDNCSMLAIHGLNFEHLEQTCPGGLPEVARRGSAAAGRSSGFNPCAMPLIS